MKKISLLFSICLAMGLGITQLSAQSVQKWDMSTYWSPVVCEGTLVDFLEGGEIRVHTVTHYNKDGHFTWEKAQIKGWVTSESGERFTIKELDKTYRTDHWYVTWTYHLKGDMGHHYIGTMTYNYFNRSITVGKTHCR